jgi:phosphomannomutase
MTAVPADAASGESTHRDSARLDLAARARAWAAGDPDPATRAELLALLAAGDTAALAERCSARLEFGTAGIRGVLGAGPGRMNRAIARQVGAGLAQVLLARVAGAAERGVAVAHDMRRLSHELALEVCGALAGAGLRVHLVDGRQPTPLLAFAVLELGCAAGVMVTASHNPPQYNGIKVYWDNGVQIVPPIDAEISAAIDEITAITEITGIDATGAIDAVDAAGAAGAAGTAGASHGSAYGGTAAAAFQPETAGGAQVVGLPGAAGTRPFLAPAAARARRLLVEAPADLAARYLAAIGRQTPAVPWDPARPAPRIVYTPLHGVALALARRAFAQRGFTDLAVVAAQAAPDGGFPTVAFPNPEEPGALDLALRQAADEQADLVLAHDPDGDRLAAAARTEDGSLQVLTGDEIGCLLGWHLLAAHAAAGTLKPHSFVVTTVVSSSQLARIAHLHGIHCEITLTGLKWIWSRALELERRGGPFLFGYEEALGYSVGAAVRDKDGIGAGVLLAEMARAAAAAGETLFDRLAAIQSATGVVATRPLSLPLPPAEAQARVRRVVAQVAAGHPAMAALGVTRLSDHETRERRDVRGGERGGRVGGGAAGADGAGSAGGASLAGDSAGAVTAIDLPATPLVVLEMADGSKARLRPSGTEPKLKVYLEAAEPPAPRREIAAGRRRAAATLDRLEHTLRALLAQESDG